MIIDGITLPTGEELDPTELATLDNGAGVATAWVKFNGTNGSIYSSHNVSSVTRTGLGKYTINFTTPLSNADYAAIGTSSLITAGWWNVGMGTATTTSLSISARYNGAYYDLSQIHIVIYGG